nr:folylpolyglutamate synthase/dihydrofolate synthase family protein [Edaphobacter aggregans]
MRYQDAVDHLYARGYELAPHPGETSPSEFDVNHMRILAGALGDPHLKFSSILIAGTNGKGSAAATLASILDASGYKTGLYTSPHLSRINERVQTSAQDVPGNRLRSIGDDTFARLYVQVDDAATELVRQGALPHSPSLFEVVTALAFLHFAEQQVEVAVIEVGLGGRLDATNIVQPLVSVITDIALDHMEWLGSTIAEIAREKAGILRPKGILVTLPQHPDANNSIDNVAVSLDVRRINAADYIPPRTERLQDTRNQYTIAFAGRCLHVNSPLPGEHQRRNVALALAAANELQKNQHFTRITQSSIEQGIRQTHWPARLESLLGDNNTRILLDVAHNPAGIWTLRSYLSSLFSSDNVAPRHLIFGALRDKSIQEMAQVLFPLFTRPTDRIHLVAVNNPRAASLDDLKAASDAIDTPTSTHVSIADALKDAPATGNSIIVIAGSLYLVAEARTLLLGDRI